MDKNNTKGYFHPNIFHHCTNNVDFILFRKKNMITIYCIKYIRANKISAEKVLIILQIMKFK